MKIDKFIFTSGERAADNVLHKEIIIRTTITIALLLFAATIFAYPVLRGEGTSQFTVYGEQRFELVDEIDLGVTLRKSEDLQYWEWYDANNNLLNRCPINPHISEIVPVNTNGY